MKTITSFRIIQTEMILTQVLFNIPILNLFWRDYAHMDQVAIAVSQILFMLVLIFLDIPTGWLADRFSRKWSNVLGDLISATGLVFYAFATNLYGVVLGEIVFSIGSAFSNGTDIPQLETHCKKLGKDFRKTYAHIQSITPIATALGMVIGGIIGGKNIRIAMLASTLPFIVGSAISIFTLEFKTDKQSVKRTSLKQEFMQAGKEIKQLTTYAFRGHRELASTMWAKTIVSESTHVLIWITTPLMIMAGMPLWLVGLGWAINNLSVSAGAYAAKRWARELSTRSITTVALSSYVISCLILGYKVNLLTIWLFIVFGLIRGWGSATMPARVQELAPEEFKATINSLSSTLNRLVYIPLILAVSYIAKTNIQHALFLSAGMFLVLGALAFLRMQKRYTKPGVF